MNCLSSLAVDDLVYHSTTANNTAIKAIDNQSIEPVMGIVKKKITTITAKVLLLGVYTGLTLDRGKLFVDTDGTFKIGTPPNSYYRQHLGYSFGNGSIIFNPQMMRTKHA